MTDKLQREINRGDRARTLLADELIAEARTHMEAELWRLFKETGPQDAQTLTYIKAMQYFHAKYFGFLERAVTDGKMARAKLEIEKKTVGQRIRAIVNR